MQNVDILPTEKNQSCCKNHPNLPSGYFLTDQPSIKYCKNCALNVALCGRKIEKQLTPEQQKRKSEITAVVNQLKKQLIAISAGQNLNKETEIYYKQIGKPFQDRINELQKSINQLTELKQALTKNYQQKFVKQLQSLLQARQTNTANQLQIQRLLQKIESNFGYLIENEDSQYLQKELKEWNQVIAKSTQNLMNQHICSQIKSKILMQAHELFELCDKISQFKVHFQDITYKSLLPMQENKQNFIPVLQFNCLQSSRLIEELKINLTANAQLKSKNVKKVATDRDHQQFNKRSNRKQSIVNEGLSDWVLPQRKAHQK